jgi:aryl-alcohol dehydrogenase-like predicted oxidoreductase
MKVYVRGFATKIPGFDTVEPFLHFALSQNITTAVIGCDSIEQLEQNVAFTRSFTPMSAERMEELTRLVAPHARSLMYYKP